MASSQADHLQRWLSQRGHRGGALRPHRALDRLPLPAGRIAGALALTLAFTAALAALQPWLAQGWGELVAALLQALQLPGHFEPPTLPAAMASPLTRAWWTLPVPVLDLHAPRVGARELALHAAVLALLWLASARLPDAATPARYLLRFALLVHAASVAFLAAWPQGFVHTAAAHLEGGLRQGWALMLLVPWLHLATFHLFPVAAWQRVAVTTLSLAHLAVLTPLLVACHALALSTFGLVVLPLLVLVLGVMLPVLGLVALYGWAMSWHDPAGDDTPAPRPR